MTIEATIAANRFGYGARPNEINLASKDPQSWLINQLQPVQFNNKLPTSAAVVTTVKEYRMQQKKDKMTGNTKSASNKEFRKTIRELTADGVRQAIRSENSISWRLLDFFSNHFSVSGNGLILKALAPTLEREAIAPHLFGNFESMLMAVVMHPAMIIYLNNERSFGPNSRLGKKRGKGLNENLAREILELHTLGVNSGYNQKDVTELAKAITGWSVINSKKEKGEGFRFRVNGHEPGERTLLGKNYANKGVNQGKLMLLDLARHPSTAQFICNKLVRHFISDTPDPKLVNKLESTWKATNGDIRKVMITLIRSKEAWQESAEKFKTPRDFVISSFRAIGRKNIKSKQLLNSLDGLGQQPFNAGTPAGFSDEKMSWDGSSALMKRIDWSLLLAGYQKKDVKKVMSNTLSYVVSEHTFQMVSRAESRQQAYALLLMSPEFQRR
jgi:uncharacterized protein (DUF1800 family)